QVGGEGEFADRLHPRQQVLGESLEDQAEEAIAFRLGHAGQKNLRAFGRSIEDQLGAGAEGLGTPGHGAPGRPTAQGRQGIAEEDLDLPAARSLPSLEASWNHAGIVQDEEVALAEEVREIEEVVMRPGRTVQGEVEEARG